MISELLKIKNSTALFLLILALKKTFAMDTIVIGGAQGNNDRRQNYSTELLRIILEKTSKEYGPYRLVQGQHHMSRARLFAEMQTGRIINVTSMPTDTIWQNKLPFVGIPIDLGLQSWRLIVTNSSKLVWLQDRVESQQLRNAKIGVGNDWILRSILDSNGYSTVKVNNYEGLFRMLQAGRSDFLIRSITEVFDELAAQKSENNEITIEKSLVVYSRIPCFYFISPKELRLHQRINTGMSAMLRDGSLKKFVLAYYRESLIQANLCKRKRIDIGNSYSDYKIDYKNYLWINPIDPRYGFCKAGLYNFSK